MSHRKINGISSFVICLLLVAACGCRRPFDAVPIALSERFDVGSDMALLIQQPDTGMSVHLTLLVLSSREKVTNSVQIVERLDYGRFGYVITPAAWDENSRSVFVGIGRSQLLQPRRGDDSIAQVTVGSETSLRKIPLASFGVNTDHWRLSRFMTVSDGSLCFCLERRFPEKAAAGETNYRLITWRPQECPSNAKQVEGVNSKIGQRVVEMKYGRKSPPFLYMGCGATNALAPLPIPDGKLIGFQWKLPHVDFAAGRGWLLSGDGMAESQNKISWLRIDGSVERLGKGHFASWLAEGAVIAVGSAPSQLLYIDKEDHLTRTLRFDGRAHDAGGRQSQFRHFSAPIVDSSGRNVAHLQMYESEVSVAVLSLQKHSYRIYGPFSCVMPNTANVVWMNIGEVEEVEGN